MVFVEINLAKSNKKKKDTLKIDN